MRTVPAQKQHQQILKSKNLTNPDFSSIKKEQPRLSATDEFESGSSVVCLSKSCSFLEDISNRQQQPADSLMVNKVSNSNRGSKTFWSNVIELSSDSSEEDEGNDENNEYAHPMRAVSALNKSKADAVHKKQDLEPLPTATKNSQCSFPDRDVQRGQTSHVASRGNKPYSASSSTSIMAKSRNVASQQEPQKKQPQERVPKTVGNSSPSVSPIPRPSLSILKPKDQGAISVLKKVLFVTKDDEKHNHSPRAQHSTPTIGSKIHNTKIQVIPIPVMCPFCFLACFPSLSFLSLILAFSRKNTVTCLARIRRKEVFLLLLVLLIG